MYPCARLDPAELFEDIPGAAERVPGASANDRIIVRLEVGSELPNLTIS